MRISKRPVYERYTSWGHMTNGATDLGTMSARITWTGAAGRAEAIRGTPLEAGEFLVEVTDRYVGTHAHLTAPCCPDAAVVARAVPTVRKAFFEDRAESRDKAIMKVRDLRGVEYTLHAPSGEVIERRAINLFVVKRGPARGD